MTHRTSTHIRQMVGRRTLLAILVTVALAALLGGIILPVRAQDDPWQFVGPAGLISETSFGSRSVSPGWPADGLIVANGPWVIRSDDGGSTWTYLPLQGNDASSVWIVKGSDRRPILLTVRPNRDAEDGSVRAPVLTRSMDRGESWSPVLPLGEGDSDGTHEVIAPLDGAGTLFYKTARRLYRSDDDGLTWKALDVGTPDDQRLTVVRLSPSFAQDRTLFAVASTASPMFPYRQSPSSPQPPPAPAEHRTSAGMFVSHDAGENWQSAVAGLDADGQPYHYVADLTLSPSFGQDRTAFVWAWGPAELVDVRGEQPYVFANALFRTRDAGASWERVWDRPTRVTDVDRGRLYLTLAPPEAGSTGAPQVILIAAQQASLVRNPSQRPPAGSPPDADLEARCDLSRSLDGGDSWAPQPPLQPLIEPFPIRVCHTLRALPSTAGSRTLLAIGAGFGVNTRNDWIESRDGGATWQSLGAPAGRKGGLLTLVAADPAGPLLFAGGDGLWLHGGAPVPPPSAPVCRIPPDPAFARYFLSNPRLTNVDSQIGCPTAPAQLVRYQRRRLGGALGLWPEADARADWLFLRISSPDSRFLGGEWEPHPKVAAPWTGPADDTIETVDQPYWFGRLLTWTDPAGESRVIRLEAPTQRQQGRQWSESNLDQSRR